MNNGPKTGDKLYDESMDIIAALGSVSNIQTVSACATRLRVSLKDNNVVNEGVFKKLGAPGVLKVGVGIQAILGGKADIYSQEINDILANPDKTPQSKPVVEQKTEPKVEHQSVKLDLTALVNGKFIDLTKVADEVFSKKMMGEGFGVEPEDGNVYSPVTGIKTAEGLEVLLHLGLETVELEGKPFTMHVKEDDQVTPDTLLATADVEQIKDAGKDPVVLTLITNTSDYVANAKNLVKSGDQVEVHHNVFEITTK